MWLWLETSLSGCNHCSLGGLESWAAEQLGAGSSIYVLALVKASAQEEQPGVTTTSSTLLLPPTQLSLMFCLRRVCVAAGDPGEPARGAPRHSGGTRQVHRRGHQEGGEEGEGGAHKTRASPFPTQGYVM